MVSTTTPEKKRLSPFKRWLYKGSEQTPEGPHEQAQHGQHTHPWWQVMCLTGVDYFSTLGYQPGIAALAAGALSPIATLILVLLTLLGALPIYRRVAAESPHGEGSISMLENLLARWKGKLFVLVLLGFVATDFIITITLSAADATAHALENPFVGHLSSARGWNVHGNPMLMIGIALLLFPKLALGLSGFETGVAVMPLVRGDKTDTEEKPEGRIRNTRKLLVTAALIMSVFLITSSIVTITLIPA